MRLNGEFYRTGDADVGSDTEALKKNGGLLRWWKHGAAGGGLTALLIWLGPTVYDLGLTVENLKGELAQAKKQIEQRDRETAAQWRVLQELQRRVTALDVSVQVHDKLLDWSDGFPEVEEEPVMPPEIPDLRHELDELRGRVEQNIGDFRAEQLRRAPTLKEP